MGRMKSVWRWGLVVAVVWHAAPSAAEECPQPSAPIATDRPDTTNSAIVVPFGSLQNENGANLSARNGAQAFDGTNSRWRLGIAPCLEVLIDVPNYVGTLRGSGPSGFGDAAPALKWQVSPIPGKVDLSVTMGAALPTGAHAVAGSGVQPYLQFPWAVDLGHGWAITGMETNFFTPLNQNKFANQSTFVIEKEFDEKWFLFVEYVGDFPESGGVGHLINSGGGYRITETQQIDFHVAFGLNHVAPTYVYGVNRRRTLTPPRSWLKHLAWYPNSPFSKNPIGVQA
jgi:Putative MetA-pathway of phenol degradation